MSRTRVLIADDHALVAEGLARLLSPEYEVVGISPNGRRLLEDTLRLNPDVVCLDIAMPELNGIEAALHLARTAPRVRIVFVTQQVDLQYLRAAFRAGACGYVAKQSASEELLIALRKVVAGLHHITPLIAKQFPDLAHELQRNPTKFFLDALTPRQREVLQLVAEGKTVREISVALKISPKTVEFHKNALMNELGLRTTADLTPLRPRLASSRLELAGRGREIRFLLALIPIATGFSPSVRQIPCMGSIQLLIAVESGRLAFQGSAPICNYAGHTDVRRLFFREIAFHIRGCNRPETP